MTTMQVFFATNRNLISDEDGNADQRPGDDEPRFGVHPADFRVGTAEVEIETRDRVRGMKVNDEAKFLRAKLAEETYDSETGEFIKKGSGELFPVLMAALGELNDSPHVSGRKRSALVFIPGFAYSFRESIERGALLAHLYSTEVHELVQTTRAQPYELDSLA